MKAWHPNGGGKSNYLWCISRRLFYLIIIFKCNHNIARNETFSKIDSSLFYFNSLLIYTAYHIKMVMMMKREIFLLLLFFSPLLM